MSSRLPAPADVPVVCAQSGIENERMAARRFTNVYGMLVYVPATHLEPEDVPRLVDLGGGLRSWRIVGSG